MAQLFDIIGEQMAGDLALSSCRNLTEDEIAAYIYNPAKRIFITIMVPCIAVFGIVANSAFLFVIYRIPYMRTTTNFYLANLAVSDGLLLVVTSLRYTWTYYDSPTVDFKYGTPFNQTAGCVIPVLLTSLFNFTSVFFITWVAIERYHAVCKPLTYRARTNKVHVVKLTCFAWIFTLMYVIPHGWAITLRNFCWRWPPSLTKDGGDIVRIMSVCEWDDWAIISVSFFDLCQFLLAFIANSTMYLSIVFKLKERKKKERNMVGPCNRVARMLAITAVVFFACLAPYQLVNIADIVDMFVDVNIYKGNMYNLFVWIGRVAFLLNSMVNPIIYNVSNPDYRHAFKSAFYCGRRTATKRGFGPILQSQCDNEMKPIERLSPKMDI